MWDSLTGEMAKLLNVQIPDKISDTPTLKIALMQPNILSLQ